MTESIPRYLFDRRDYRLLDLVNQVVRDRRITPAAHAELYALFHPEGIKELAESRGLRIAYATIMLVRSLTAGRVEDRLGALHALKEEVLEAAVGPMPRNTARILLQIMKELVRCGDDPQRQLALAHDFRSAASGKPRIIRKQLKKYHLLEMSEAWNQVSFDDHVHDANTKGRKTPTHLIMDAWIKGIRRLRVIYYHHIASKSAAELIQAAAIMGITLRIGIEFATRFHDRYAQLIWVPRGFVDEQEFLCFLAEPGPDALMEEGRKVAAYQQQIVISYLEAFNAKHRAALRADFGVALPPLSSSDFLSYVAPGQASMLHLAKYIHIQVVTQLPAIMEKLRQSHAAAEDDDQRNAIVQQVGMLDRLDSDLIMERYLRPEHNPGIPDPGVYYHSPELPVSLKSSPAELVDRLQAMRSGYRFTLNLSNLHVEDVLEILYDCEGRISRLEIFNLKDYTDGIVGHIADIMALQQALNQGNVVALKRIIRQSISRLANAPEPDELRIGILEAILHDIITFKTFYSGVVLESRIGSDSTGGSHRYHGMGLVVTDTLPWRTRREIRSSATSRLHLPIALDVAPQTTYRRLPATNVLAGLLGRLRKLPGCSKLGLYREHAWLILEYATRPVPEGNIVTLGGITGQAGNRLQLIPETTPDKRPIARWRYMNSFLKNSIKVLLGFIPAFATFMLTKDWWLLAYGGAFIWFGITGLRNVLQSVLGGGGWRRSPLLRWNDLISWERVTDSLLFTGFSVPLLDYIAKTVILDRGMGITTETHPLWLYTFMALANGVYLVSHNLFRGLPKGAAIANLFRSILSIPLAFGLNVLLTLILTWIGIGPAAPILQRWAAIISKSASDVVAGIIEGTADRFQNIERRRRGIRHKFEQILDTYAQLEILLPDIEVEQFLDSPDQFSSGTPADIRDLAERLYVHALDLLYFWMYQPRARLAMRTVLREFSPDEQQLLLQTQMVLQHQRPISTLFIEGMLGKKFSKSLAFYLSHSPGYLAAVRKMMAPEAI